MFGEQVTPVAEAKKNVPGVGERRRNRFQEWRQIGGGKPHIEMPFAAHEV